jgi:hypothetical protein
MLQGPDLNSKVFRFWRFFRNQESLKSGLSLFYKPLLSSLNVVVIISSRTPNKERGSGGRIEVGEGR